MLLRKQLKLSQLYKENVALVELQDLKQSKPIELHSQTDRTKATEQQIRRECRQPEHTVENNHRSGSKT